MHTLWTDTEIEMSDADTLEHSPLEAGRAEVRRQAGRFDQAPHVTITTIAQLIETAISFGAGIYNDGDEEGCYELYDLTTRLIIEASRKHPIGEQTDRMIDDLLRALHRAEACADPRMSAWMLRHAFDKTVVTQQVESERVQWLVRLGEDAFLRGDYGGSADTLRTAASIAHELFAREEGEGGIQTFHLAVLYYGHAMLLLEDDATAYEWLRLGVRAVPHLTKLEFDLRDLGEHYKPFLHQLERLALTSEQDTAYRRALFLRAYVMTFSGMERQSSELLRFHIGQDPEDEDAQRLLAMMAPPARD